MPRSSRVLPCRTCPSPFTTEQAILFTGAWHPRWLLFVADVTGFYGGAHLLVRVPHNRASAPVCLRGHSGRS